VGASLATGGAHPIEVLLAVVGVGLISGLVGAAATVLLRIPSFVATAVVAGGCHALTGVVGGGAEIIIERELLGTWVASTLPLQFVGSLYLAVMLLALLGCRLRWVLKLSDKTRLLAMLVVSSALASLGGLCWLIKSGQAPAASLRLIDLRVVAAAVLAGAVVLRGIGRGMLVGLFVPPAMLVATIWQISVWDIRDSPLPVNIIALVMMVLLGQLSFTSVAPGRPWRRTLSGVLSASGLVVVSLATLTPYARGRFDAAVAAGGTMIWAAGVATGLLSGQRQRPRGT